MLRPLLAAASGSYVLFYTLLVLHVAAALTGFASIGFAGTYAGRATHFATVTDLAGPLPTWRARRRTKPPRRRRRA